jgi:hypothetical protein
MTAIQEGKGENVKLSLSLIKRYAMKKRVGRGTDIPFLPS